MTESSSIQPLSPRQLAELHQAARLRALELRREMFDEIGRGLAGRLAGLWAAGARRLPVPALPARPVSVASVASASVSRVGEAAHCHQEG